MADELRDADMPRSSDLLARLNDEGLLTVKILESLLGIAPRSGYSYLTRTAPSADQLRAIFQHAPAPAPVAIQLAILNFLCEGTRWSYGLTPENPVQSEADVDTDAVFDHCIHALTTAADTLGSYRANGKMGFKLQPEEVSIMSEHLKLACRQSAAAHAALALLARTAVPPVPSPASSQHN